MKEDEQSIGQLDVDEDTASVLQLIRPNIRVLTPYRCARDDYNEGILLDANENTFGPPQHDGQMNDTSREELERYPCPHQLKLKSKIAQLRGVTPENIFLGVGSDEAIDLIIRVVCKPNESTKGTKDSILITPPTYGMYGVCAQIHNVEVVKVLLTPETFQIKTEKVIQQARENTAKIVFLCHPGNPTAAALRLADVQQIHEALPNTVVVVDEAYIDFHTKTDSAIGLLNDYPRVVVLQTLSKAFGLAGIRLGMAYGHPALIRTLNSVKAPYNISRLTSATALEAFEHLDTFYDNVSQIKGERTRVIESLEAMDGLIDKVFDSATNFILIRLSQRDAALEVYKRMPAKGVVIRYRGNLPLLEGCLRITVGRPDENDVMLRVLSETIREVMDEQKS